jgi:hypothetical protein
MNENERKVRARENCLNTYQNQGSVTKASKKIRDLTIHPVTMDLSIQPRRKIRTVR